MKIPPLILAAAALSPTDSTISGHSLNRWKWPEPLKDFKPEGFDDLPDFSHDKSTRSKYNHPDFRNLISFLLMSVSPYQSSRHHWEHDLGKGPEDHLAWWIETYPKQCPAFLIDSKKP